MKPDLLIWSRGPNRTKRATTNRTMTVNLFILPGRSGSLQLVLNQDGDADSELEEDKQAEVLVQAARIHHLPSCGGRGAQWKGGTSAITAAWWFMYNEGGVEAERATQQSDRYYWKSSRIAISPILRNQSSLSTTINTKELNWS